MELNPNNPEAKRLESIKEDAKRLGESMLPPTPPPQIPQEQGPQLTEKQMEDIMKQQWIEAALSSPKLSKPTPEQAKFSEYLIRNDPFIFDENNDFKSGDVPPDTLYKNYGTLNKNVVLSNLTRDHDMRVMDIMDEIAELSRLAATPHLSEADNAMLDQDAKLNYATTRRAVDGFAMESLNKSIHEQVSTLQTQGQVQYAKQKKNRLQQLLSGGE